MKILWMWQSIVSIQIGSAKYVLVVGEERIKRIIGYHSLLFIQAVMHAGHVLHVSIA